MKTAIVYESTHHGNTKKICDAIAKKFDVQLFNIKDEIPSLDEFDFIGIASGISFGKFYKNILERTSDFLPENKKVFFIFTAGSPRESHADSVKKIAESKNCKCLGSYFCKGFDTYGPFKVVGGINKNCPTEDDLKKAVEFYEEIIQA